MLNFEIEHVVFDERSGLEIQRDEILSKKYPEFDHILKHLKANLMARDTENQCS